ncbi:TPA: DUF551 domain-containing protein [Klebsiella variicola subsp. variicola]|nr:DUF551 domain-containing protein [Klebsiella variicola subsp. variicola]
MKDHEIRELVNQLRDVAIKYHGASQLREKIARTVRAAILQAQSDDDGGQTDDERIMAIEGIIKPTSDCDAPVYPDAEKRIADAVELLKKAAPGMLAGKSGPDGPLAGRMKSPVIPDGYVMVPKEPTEEMLQASYREAAVYSPTAYRAMIAAAPQSPGSEPAIVPGKWIPVSEQMPELDARVLLYFSDYGGHIEDGCIGDEGDGPYHYFFDGDALSHEPTHWMKLPEPPNDGN